MDMREHQDTIRNAALHATEDVKRAGLPTDAVLHTAAFIIFSYATASRVTTDEVLAYVKLVADGLVCVKRGYEASDA